MNDIIKANNGMRWNVESESDESNSEDEYK